VAQARRLGHRMEHKINDIYSHVADSIEQTLLAHLEARWTRALTNANSANCTGTRRDGPADDEGTNSALETA
ncbi:hypothetical protein ABIA33_007094, partial [Streptacidiphilus sp. MAP12-16]|uniref:hypothetical protein n=1 Tax=Streptacidiphilus sp. MAP12-16 TaxID=3156300 RepID=UPI0035185C80